LPNFRIFALTALAMLAFAGNSLLCRLALKQTQIDAASFTAIRILSGALMLWLIARFHAQGRAGAGNWLSAIALLVYAAAFSFAYRWLSAATGSLLLFCSCPAWTRRRPREQGSCSPPASPGASIRSAAKVLAIRPA
jgi:hypothetical protein